MRHRRILLVNLVGIALGIASLVGPLWTATYSTTDGLPRTTYWTILGVTYTGPVSPGAIPTTWTSDIRDLHAIASAFMITAVLIGLGLLLAAIIAVSLARRGRKEESAEPTGGLGLLAFMLIGVGLLYLMMALPRAPEIPFEGPNQLGFWGALCPGSVTTCSSGARWGAGWAWYTGWASSVLLLGAGIALWSGAEDLTDVHGLLWLSRNGWVLTVILGPYAFIANAWGLTTSAAIAGAIALAGLLGVILVRPAKIAWVCRKCGAVYYRGERSADDALERTHMGMSPRVPVGALYAFALPQQRCPACNSTHFRRATRVEFAHARERHEVYGEMPWKRRSP